MNELLFFSEIAILIVFLLFSLKLGKTALALFVVLQTIFANLFVTKQMELFSLTVTCSDVYVVSAIFGLNLIQEYFGKKEAQKVIYLSFFFLALFMVLAKIHLLYQPSVKDSTHGAFITIFSNTPRIVVASILTFFIVQWFDLFFYGFLKARYKQNSIIFRMGFSSVISQILDTLLFSFLGLYKIVDSIYDIIILSSIIKLLTIVSSGSFMFFLKKFFNLKENESF